MRTLGLIGGIGPASTPEYYLGIINRWRGIVQDGNYPKIIINSVNMTEMLGYVAAKDWDTLIDFLARELQKLAMAGAEIAALCSNTPHIVFDRLQAKSPLPLVSIVEATCQCAKEHACRRVIVFGTRFTMQSGLYTEAMQRYGVEAIVPDMRQQDLIHSIIFPNLEEGIILPEQKANMLALATELMQQHNADGLVLGCTELPLMVQDGDLDTLLLNTTKIHIQAIVEAMFR